mmetsp:Transcript_7182/g.13096  ORF Transcript_7182/g.13096 Transcript_7182/m.13096 type:complete len:221 (-) Transcript_7182:585-1247(-)
MIQFPLLAASLSLLQKYCGTLSAQSPGQPSSYKSTPASLKPNDSMTDCKKSANTLMSSPSRLEFSCCIFTISADMNPQSFYRFRLEECQCFSHLHALCWKPWQDLRQLRKERLSSLERQAVAQLLLKLPTQAERRKYPISQNRLFMAESQGITSSGNSNCLEHSLIPQLPKHGEAIEGMSHRTFIWLNATNKSWACGSNVPHQYVKLLSKNRRHRICLCS